jgi:hypothetical protein
MNSLLVLVLVLMSSGAACDQTTSKVDEALEAKTFALDTQGWEAWENNDATWFNESTTADFEFKRSDGIGSGAEVMKSTATDCKVSASSLPDFSFVELDENAALLTFTATQDAVCGE